ncbi:single-stranded DNA-binding protein [Citricoccus parietis]|uniref:Single-stranded DNA-binding protein n=1 Tax=Citricoccus parietis TaxID=592307 RepID=A0ABV6F513_9MICC
MRPKSAEWVDGIGQAHALAVDSRQVATAETTQRDKERTMTSVGKKTVQGNLTADPRQVQTKAGQDMVVFKMAENHRRFNESSRQWQDVDPTFYDVAVDRDRLGANVLSSLHKGDRVTVSGNYQVGAYSTSTGQPGLNHRIWAEDVAASMQYNPVTVLPREQNRGRDSLSQFAGQAVDQGLQPEKMTPESFTSWAAQNPVKVPGAQQGAGVSR